MSIAVARNYIVKTPGMLGGEPHIAGKRVTITMIVDLYFNQDTSIEELVEHFPLTPAEIYAALSYYYDNVQEIDALIADREAYEEAIWQVAPDGRLDLAKSAEVQDLAGHIRQSRSEELTATEVAYLYGISTAAVREAAIGGRVPARKSGSVWLIRRHDAEARWGKHRAGRQ